MIADLSVNFVERYFLEAGHVANRELRDYGYDLAVTTFDEFGNAEEGMVFLQLKATDHISRYENTDNNVYAIPIDKKHIRLWQSEPMPVFLLLYDAAKRKGYWLDIKGYLRTHPHKKSQTKSVTVYIPKKNVFGKSTIQKMRQRKSIVVQRFQEKDDG